MGQILHGSATTTEAVRRAIQNSQASLRQLAGRYGINPKTVAKWRRRSSVCIVGWGKTLGCSASRITVNLPASGLIHRGAGKGGKAHTVFRAGEVHGRITPRAEEVCRLVAYADSAKVTANLW